MIARLLGGRKLPGALVVSVGAQDGEWPYGSCTVIVTVWDAGPLRVHYRVDALRDASWVRRAPVREWRRRRALGAVLGSGLLDEPQRQAPGGVPGWVHVALGERSHWTPLRSDGRYRGVPVVRLVLGLVPDCLWSELHLLRDRAWAEAMAGRALPAYPPPWPETVAGDARVDWGPGPGVALPPGGVVTPETGGQSGGAASGGSSAC